MWRRPPGSTFLGNFGGIFMHRRKHFIFHSVACTVHICEVIIQKLIQQYARITIQKILCTVKLYSNVFQCQTPPSSGKFTSTNQNTAVVSCVSYAHTHTHIHFASSPSAQNLLRCTLCWWGRKVNVIVHYKTDRQLTTAVFWFAEIPDDGSVHHWNKLECSLSVYRIFWIVLYAFCWISFYIILSACVSS